MKERNLSFIKSITYLVPLVTKAFPFLVVSYIILSIVLSTQAGLTIYVNQYFYDALTETVVNHVHINNAIYGAIGIIGMLLIGQLFGKIYGFVWIYLGDKIEYKLLYSLNEKTSQIPAQYFEDSDFLAKIDKARDGVYGSVGMIATIVEVFVYFFGYFAITGIYLWNVHPFLVLSLIIIFVPSLVAVLLQSKLYAEETDDIIYLRRKSESYYGSAINSRETRLFGIFGYFYGLIRDVNKMIFVRKRKTEKRNFVIRISLNLCRMIGWCGMIFFMIVELTKGNISVGVFAAVYSSVSGMFENCETLLLRIKVDFSENLGMINDYVDFIKQKTENHTNASLDMTKGISVQNVSFKYPSSQSQAVKNININISPGETIAIVGSNGSGKSTLAKLLCGLYVPEEGCVYIGGIDSSLLDFKTLFSKSTAVFQNYMKYSGLTLSENVKISKISKTSDSEVDVEKCLSIVDALFAFDLPNGYDTIMDRAFDGIELSGGEWQRLAMARGLYREHDLILLDEPTAAIDPLEETRIYNLFAQHSKNKICILITHRLASVKIADKILVMENGYIVESGTHDELLKSNGLYASMWDATVKGYNQ